MCVKASVASVPGHRFLLLNLGFWRVLYLENLSMLWGLHAMSKTTKISGFSMNSVSALDTVQSVTVLIFQLGALLTSAYIDLD